MQQWIAGGLLLVGAALLLDGVLLKKSRDGTRFLIDAAGAVICIVVGLVLL